VHSLPNYEVIEHRLTKEVRRALTHCGCLVEYRKHLFIDTQVILEEIVLSCKVDLFRRM
jgi:hypothetical protein